MLSAFLMNPPKPMLAQDAHGDFSRVAGEGWMIEPKLDGWRFLLRVTDDGVEARSRQGRMHKLPGIEADLMGLPEGTVLDAEVVTPDGYGPSVATALAHPGVVSAYAVVFDVLAFGPYDTTGYPLRERRKMLAAIKWGPLTRLMPAHPPVESTHRAWLEQGLEGSVGKRLDSLYRPGVRSRDWLKVKPQATAEAKVIGFREGKGGRAGEVGAFEVVMLDSGVRTSVATRTDQQRAEIVDHPEKYLGRVIEMCHHGINDDSGKPRHPVFHRLRPDRE